MCLSLQKLLKMRTEFNILKETGFLQDQEVFSSKLFPILELVKECGCLLLEFSLLFLLL